MRVAMYYRNSDVRLQEMPTPTPGPGEMLVKAMACGICGSDVLEWYRIKKAPLVLGHEMAGEIAAVGPGVQKYKIGQRVFVSHHVPCNTCRLCLSGHHTACETLHTTNYFPGGFAEYVRVPPINVDRGVFVLPDSVSYDDATFIEPLSCVLRGQKAIRPDPGSTILVIGSGISGLLHILAARWFGAGRIIATDVNPHRRELAKKFGAHVVLSATDDVPAKVREANDGRLADRVILCAGAPQAAQQALRSVERGGTVLFFAVPTEDIAVPINSFWRNDVTMKTSYAGDPTDVTQALDLIQAGALPTRDLITHRLGLADAQKGFLLVAQASESIKVIIYPNQ